jgi:holliday junction resolvase YEN1
VFLPRSFETKLPLQAGLVGFGPQIALGLARSGLGDSLLQAARGAQSALPAFLSQWREDVRHQLRTDPGDHIGRKYVGLADQVVNTFPNMDVLSAYVYPLTSWSQGRHGPGLPLLGYQAPDVAGIAGFCQRTFSWGGPAGILAKLHNVLWEGTSIRMLCEVISSLTLT